MYKKCFLLGTVAYIMYLVFALFFYKERVAFTDIALHTFEIVTTNSFTIHAARFAALFTELLPLLARKANLPLEDIMVAYSLSFGLFYFGFYLICGLVFKNYKMALVLLLFNILFATHTFYWTQSELPQGIAIMIVMWAYFDKERVNRNTIVQWVTMAVLLTIVAFAHTLAAVCIFYSVVYFFLTKRISKSELYLITGLFLVVFAVRNIFFFNQYDSGCIDNAFHNLKHGTLFDTYSNRTFLSNCLDKYYWIPVCFIGVSAYYVWKKEWKLLMLYAISVMGYILFINISYPTKDTMGFYIENLYLPVGVLISLPLIYDALPWLAEKKLAYAMLLFVIITSGIRIYSNHTIYTARVNWEQNFLNKHVNDKLFIADTKVPLDTLFMTWGTPYEFWLLSTTEKGQSASIIMSRDLNGIMWGKDMKKAFITTWGAFAYDQLPKLYFVFKDTASSYSVMQ